MDPQQNRLTGILLAGGMSIRMGREKGLVKVANQALYRYPLGILEKMCSEVLISTCKPVRFPEHHAMICDQTTGIGPMGGIYTCLQRSANEWSVILSYDLPLVTVDLIRFLAEQSSGYDVVVPCMEEGKPEPLCGIYSRKTIPVFEALIARKQYAIHQALAMSRTRYVILDKTLPFYRDDLFLNINREEDLRKIPQDLKLRNGEE